MSIRVTALAVAATAASLASLAVPSTAEACSCLLTTVETSWWHSDVTLRVNILARRHRAFTYYYLAEVIEPYQGCNEPGDIVIMSTPDNDAACGLPLGAGEWLLFGYDSGEIRGFDHYSFNLCDQNKSWSDVTLDELGFLEDRMITCRETGVTSCADGTLPVSCLVDPCEVAAPCAVPGECVSNFCGGCNYEYWSDTDGIVCEGP